MPSFFSGWIGYGSMMQNASLLEPADTAYQRRPILFSALENGTTFDSCGGTVGPALANWGALALAGLFDAATGGNLLLMVPLARPVVVAAGGTYTTGPGANVFVGIERSRPNLPTLYASGAVLALTPDGRAVTVNIPLQIAAGVLSAQLQSFGTLVSMATLPSQPPAAGSGQIWNNGGVLGVA